jgi:diadenosine tetraphosphate (Ap4A) HIT family hydrolase
MTQQFQLHPRLAADTLALYSLDLCEVRLLNDSRFPWLVLIPRRAGMGEVHQLLEAEQTQLIFESSLVSQALLETARADKINIGALGNLVPQLHWHVVARYKTDACWPGPVWGCGKPVPYGEEDLQTLLTKLRDALQTNLKARL